MSSITEGTFTLFQTYIKEKCGIYISSEKKYLIETRLAGLQKEMGAATLYDLYWLINDQKNINNPLIAEKIINSITTNETSWFRDQKPWNIMENMLLPEFIQELKDEIRKDIRIWSAAASTGQEAYSTAISIVDYLERNDLQYYQNNFKILASDISSEVLNFAKKGDYDSISITRGLNDNYLEKYFIKKDEKVWQVDSQIKKMVEFRQFNLQNNFFALGSFDVIFLRNVLIYFSDDLKNSIFEKARDALSKNGVLFFGSSEFYSGIEKFFISEKLNGNIFYRRK